MLDENLNELNHFVSNQNEINTAQLGQGKTIFEEMLDFENNSVVYSTGKFLLRTNLNDMGCSELEPAVGSTGSVAFPNTSNIYLNVVSLASIKNVFSFAFNSTQNQFIINNICYDTGNTRLNGNEVSTNWALSPNPSTNYITIQIKELPNNTSYYIYNTTGKQVMANALTNENINIKNLPNGVYYANIKSDNIRYNTIKFVKQ